MTYTICPILGPINDYPKLMAFHWRNRPIGKVVYTPTEPPFAQTVGVWFVPEGSQNIYCGDEFAPAYRAVPEWAMQYPIVRPYRQSVRAT